MKKYWESTPKRFRMLGDGILIMSSTLSASVMGLPISEHNKLWAVFALNLIGAIGKILTNFAGTTTDEAK